MDTLTQKRHSMQYSVSAPTLRILAKAFVVISAIANLILSPTYVSGLLKLENEICGFVMFLFILFGLVALFQATRYKGDLSLSLILNLVSLILVIALGLYLSSIFSDALKNQRALKKPEDVVKAIRLGYAICIGYGTAFLLLVAQAFVGKGEY